MDSGVVLTIRRDWHPSLDGAAILVTIIAGWWSEKYEFVSWDDDIPNVWKKSHVPVTTNQIVLYGTCVTHLVVHHLWQHFSSQAHWRVKEDFGLGPPGSHCRYQDMIMTNEPMGNGPTHLAIFRKLSAFGGMIVGILRVFWV